MLQIRFYLPRLPSILGWTGIKSQQSSFHQTYDPVSVPNPLSITPPSHIQSHTFITNILTRNRFYYNYPQKKYCCCVMNTRTMQPFPLTPCLSDGLLDWAGELHAGAFRTSETGDETKSWSFFFFLHRSFQSEQMRTISSISAVCTFQQDRH